MQQTLVIIFIAGMALASLALVFFRWFEQRKVDNRRDRETGSDAYNVAIWASRQRKHVKGTAPKTGSDK